MRVCSHASTCLHCGHVLLTGGQSSHIHAVQALKLFNGSMQWLQRHEFYVLES